MSADEETAINLLNAVICLYGSEVFSEVAIAFRYALAQNDDKSIAHALSEALLEVIRNRSCAGERTPVCESSARAEAETFRRKDAQNDQKLKQPPI